MKKLMLRLAGYDPEEIRLIMDIRRALKRISKELPSINKPTLKVMWSNICTTDVYFNKREKNE